MKYSFASFECSPVPMQLRCFRENVRPMHACVNMVVSTKGENSFKFPPLCLMVDRTLRKKPSLAIAGMDELYVMK